MKKLTLRYWSGNYSKALERLEKNIRSGRFASYTQRKKQQIWKRICRYARHLGIQIKASIVTACVATGLCMVTNRADAQATFAVQTGSNNPLDGVAVYYARPSFVDIDGDGDQDLFIGAYFSPIAYYKNTGTSSTPVFSLQTPGNNPLNLSTNAAVMAFGDIDGDGDKDVFIGSAVSSIAYYKNTGTATVPVFTLQAGVANPLNGVVATGGWGSPSLVDIDGDGDLDVFISNSSGTMNYYKNTGTTTAPVLTLQTAGLNPFNGIDAGSRVVNSFGDVDQNGTKDLFLGEAGGAIQYYKNTGTSSSPVFTAQTGVNNPFNGLDVGNGSVPAIVDINNDNLVDIFIANSNTAMAFYKNTTTILPLHLLDFNGTSFPGYNQLQWKTAEEVNTQQFELESGNDGITFAKIATIHAAGSGNNDYSYADKKSYSGKVFYRLKMVDIDGKFTYSNVVSLSSKHAGDLSIYPNPAKDVINISTGESLLRTMARLYNSEGRLVQNILINNRQEQVNVQSLPTGIYSIKFADGAVQRFLKE